MLKKKLEALLFSSGRKMSIEELSRLSNAGTGDIQKSLEELKKEYEDKDSSVMIIEEGDSWKLTVREQYLPLVQKIITETELSKTIMETLAVIAFKYPIRQSDLIKIRTNKAYDHLRELEEMGYISRQKHGRTNLIKLTQKFFEYFDLPEGKLKEHFKDFSSIANAIEDKEKEIETIKQEQKARAEEEGRRDEEIKEEIDLMDKEGQEVPLESYGNKERTEHGSKEKLGNLDIVEEPPEEKLEEERQRLEKIKEEDEKKLGGKENHKFEGPGIKLSKEEEKIVDEKAEKILHPQKEEPEGKKELKESENKEEDKTKKEEEPKDLLEASMEENKEEKKQ